MVVLRETTVSGMLMLLALPFLISCNGTSKKEILTEKIQYDVPVVNNDPRLDWWVNNLEGSKREPFLKRIMEAAEKGDVRLYDYFRQPLTPAAAISSLTDTLYKTLMRDRPPYEEYDTIIVMSVTSSDISRIRFLEEWRWDPATLEMEKKILAIGPVIQKETAGSTYNRLLFWIGTDKDFPAK